MTKDRYDFWTHGAAVQIEYPDRILDGGPGQAAGVPRRAGYGTVVRQEEGTDNWFHFAIPTPTWLDSDRAVHLDAFLRAKLNRVAYIRHIHVWAGRPKPVRRADNLELRGPDVNYTLNLPDWEVKRGGIAICVNVQFGAETTTSTDLGMAHFIGAGVRFREKEEF
jgi:hypothetical protein